MFIIPFTRQVDWKVVPLTFSVFLLFHFTTPSYKLDKVDDEEEEEYLFFFGGLLFYFYIVIVLLQKHLKLVGHIECERVAAPFSRNPPCRSLQARSIC